MERLVLANEDRFFVGREEAATKISIKQDCCLAMDSSKVIIVGAAAT